MQQRLELISNMFSFLPELSIVAGGNTTVAGRNVGQSTTVYGSFFYVLDLGQKTKSSDKPAKTN